jgi:V/A-type H+/Na+-transporting ATPase subunit B
MTLDLVRYRHVTEISGDILRLRVPLSDSGAIRLGDLALVASSVGAESLAQVIQIQGEQVTLQVASGTRGLATDSAVRFLGHPLRARFSANILGRVFRGSGLPIDGGPDLSQEPLVRVHGSPVNPVRRVLASRLIRTDVPMVDVFNCLVESQKIPVFAAAGEPYNEFLARIGTQADADVVVFGGLGLVFDDFHYFRTAFEDAGVFSRTVMFVNQASDPVVERLLVPDLALAVAERFAVDEGRRVLVLLTDMTAFADALKEIGVAMERVPANRGYGGDLYSQLARRYERACNFRGAGSVSILSVTTMPGGDVTHPVPDNTGYITEGQFYLRDAMIDPFGSLSRLKQHVIGKQTREDHGQLMNTMVRLFAEAVDAEQKRAMAFELSAYDLRLIEYARDFRREFMHIGVSMRLERALDLGWDLLARHFESHELFVRQALLDEYYQPRRSAALN